MSLERLKSSDTAAGMIAVAIGIFVLWEAFGYPLGSATRMGPGFFPVGLGMLMIVMGLGVILVEGRAATTIPRPAWRGLLFIVGGVAAFAALVETAGLGPAVVASILVSARADSDLRLFETLVLAITIALLSVVVFVYFLNLPLEAVAW